MSLKRKQIREAIIDLLTGETSAGSRVYGNRYRSLHQDKLPAVLVYTVNEEVTIFAESPREYQRDLTVGIQARVEADDLCDDALDALGTQIEAKMFEDHTLGELCHDVILRGAELSINEEGDNLYGALTLSYGVIYHTEAVNDPDSLLFLNKIHTEYDLTEGVSATNPTDLVTGLSAEI